MGGFYQQEGEEGRPSLREAWKCRGQGVRGGTGEPQAGCHVDAGRVWAQLHLRVQKLGSRSRPPHSPLSDTMTSLRLRALPVWFPSFGIRVLPNLITVSH